MVALAREKEHAKRPGRTRPRTPQREKRKEVPVIGSSCTWKQDELDHFGVEVKRDVDVRKMIPEQFFRFEHLEEYAECDSCR
jgi:hypothetical protein